jgi:uncharacterized protein (TIGR02646 family)
MGVSWPASKENKSVIELQHRTTVPSSLIEFLESHPQAVPKDFSDSDKFPTALKKDIKKCLNEDQGGLCVYCESRLAENKGHIDHIDSRDKHPELAFVYANFAHSCDNEKTCGHKKKAGDLPIKPRPGCNGQFMLSTDGEILPLPGFTRKQRHPVDTTLKMLGLTAKQSPHLVAERKQWIDATLAILRQAPDQLASFLADKPFRYILRRIVE